jgi:hypothetical protein
MHARAVEDSARPLKIRRIGSKRIGSIRRARTSKRMREACACMHRNASIDAFVMTVDERWI